MLSRRERLEARGDIPRWDKALGLKCAVKYLVKKSTGQTLESLVPDPKKRRDIYDRVIHQHLIPEPMTSAEEAKKKYINKLSQVDITAYLR